MLIKRKGKHVMIRVDLSEWIKEQIDKGKFWNFSHAVEVALIGLKDES